MSPKTTRFESLLEAVPDALVGMDQKGVIRFVNRQTELLFGYDRDILIGEYIERLLPEPLWQIYASHRDEYFADPRTRSSGLDLELSGRHRDGREFPVNISMSHIDTGDVLLVITAMHQIARQKRAVKHAELIEAVVESSEDAIIGTTLEGVVTSWNPAAWRMYGYFGREMIGRSASVLLPGDRAGELLDHMAKVQEGQTIHQHETTRIRTDGTTVPVSLTIAPIRDDDGTIIGASMVHRDVTAQRQAFEVAQRLASIVENSGDAIIGRALDGTVTSWNPAAERMYGYSSAESLGMSLDRLVPEDRRSEIETALVRVLAGEHVEGLETIRVRKDGTAIPVSITLSPIRDAEGAITGASAIHRDVTEQQHAAHYARSLIEADMDPLVAISPEGKVNDINRAAVEMAGLPREAILGADFTQFVAEPEKAAEYFQQVFEDGSVSDFPMTIPKPDGNKTDLRCNASVYRDLNGNVLGVLAVGRDVTSRKEGSTAHQRMEAIIESMDDAVIGRTLDGTITSWNPAAERIFGYTSAEIVGQPVDLLSPTERVGETISILSKISAGHAVENFETLRLRKDGTAITVSLTISPIRDPEGAVVGASMICRDVTELRHAAQYTRSLIEAALDPLVTISPAGEINDVNEAAVTVTGVPRNKLVGTDFSHYFTDPDKAHEAYQQAFTQGSVTGYPLTLRHRDGTLTDVLYNASVYRDTTGNVLGVLAVARDMSRQNEESEIARRLAAIVEHSDDAFIGCTLERIVTSWNPAAERMYGYSAEEIIGRSIDLTIPEDRAGEAEAVVARVAAGQPVEHLETIRARKDGTVFPVSITISPIRDANGAVVGASAIARDMAARELSAGQPEPDGVSP